MLCPHALGILYDGICICGFRVKQHLKHWLPCKNIWCIMVSFQETGEC